ncbi:hypothetical protein DFH09DRAFT_255706 [Mycena vulgaris]|nr:hypothetical protein DFH09DRAFT_255706 [Mycena vulgaris]
MKGRLPNPSTPRSRRPRSRPSSPSSTPAPAIQSPSPSTLAPADSSRHIASLRTRDVRDPTHPLRTGDPPLPALLSRPRRLRSRPNPRALETPAVPLIAQPRPSLAASAPASAYTPRRIAFLRVHTQDTCGPTSSAVRPAMASTLASRTLRGKRLRSRGTARTNPSPDEARRGPKEYKGQRTSLHSSPRYSFKRPRRSALRHPCVVSAAHR